MLFLWSRTDRRDHAFPCAVARCPSHVRYTVRIWQANGTHRQVRTFLSMNECKSAMQSCRLKVKLSLQDIFVCCRNVFPCAQRHLPRQQCGAAERPTHLLESEAEPPHGVGLALPSQNRSACFVASTEWGQDPPCGTAAQAARHPFRGRTQRHEGRSGGAAEPRLRRPIVSFRSVEVVSAAGLQEVVVPSDAAGMHRRHRARLAHPHLHAGEPADDLAVAAYY